MRLAYETQIDQLKSTVLELETYSKNLELRNTELQDGLVGKVKEVEQLRSEVGQLISG